MCSYIPHAVWRSPSQGLDLKIKRTRVVTFSIPMGWYWGMFNSNVEEDQMYSYRDEGVDGIAFMSWFKIFPLIPWYWQVLCCWRGWFQPLKANLRNAGAGGGLCWKRQNNVEGDSKDCPWLAWCLISKSPAPGIPLGSLQRAANSERLGYRVCVASNMASAALYRE